MGTGVTLLKISITESTNTTPINIGTINPESMDKIKNIALFLLPVLLFALLTLLFIQQQEVKNMELQHTVQQKIDSVRMDQVYGYLLNYGGYIAVPLGKQMLVSDSNGKFLKIEQLIKKDKYLFHFDETNCFTCVERYLPFLKKTSQKSRIWQCDHLGII